MGQSCCLRYPVTVSATHQLRLFIPTQAHLQASTSPASSQQLLLPTRICQQSHHPEILQLTRNAIPRRRHCEMRKVQCSLDNCPIPVRVGTNQHRFQDALVHLLAPVEQVLPVDAIDYQYDVSTQRHLAMDAAKHSLNEGFVDRDVAVV
jgi:hypothetical protein